MDPSVQLLDGEKTWLNARKATNKWIHQYRFWVLKRDG